MIFLNFSNSSLSLSSNVVQTFHKHSYHLILSTSSQVQCFISNSNSILIYTVWCMYNNYTLQGPMTHINSIGFLFVYKQLSCHHYNSVHILYTGIWIQKPQFLLDCMYSFTLCKCSLISESLLLVVCKLSSPIQIPNLSVDPDWVKNLL